MPVEKIYISITFIFYFMNRFLILRSTKKNNNHKNETNLTQMKPQKAD